LEINVSLRNINTFSQRIRFVSFNATFIYNIYIYIFIVKYVNKIIRIFLIKFKGCYSLVIITNAYYAALIFIIAIVSVLTAIRLRVNNSYYFKVLFMNINELWF